MNLKKHFILFIIIVSLFCTICGCANTDRKDSNTVTGMTPSRATEKSGTSKAAQGGASEKGITLYPGYMEIAKGSMVKLSPQIASNGANNSQLKWASENPDIASVAADGVVTAVKEGDTVIDVMLNQKEQQKASCSVHVKTDGSTLVYANIPKKSSDSTSSSDNNSVGKNSGTDSDKADDIYGGVPVEYPKSQKIPVEVNPKLDQFVWTITIDDSCEKTLTTKMGSIKASYKLKLKAVKNGGKTADGQYKCSATQQVKINSSDMDRNIESQSGGKVASDNSLQTQVKDCTFSLIQYNSKNYESYGTENNTDEKQPKMPDLPPLPNPAKDKQIKMPDLPPLPNPSMGNQLKMPDLPPLPNPSKEKQPKMPELPPLIPIWKMALGSMSFSTDATFGRTFTTEDGKGSGKNQVNKQANSVPFKIGVHKDGSVELCFINNSSIGPLLFKGYLTKKPFRP